MKVAPCRISGRGLGGHEQAGTKKKEEEEEDNACLEDLDGLLGGNRAAIEEPSRNGPEPLGQRWRMISCPSFWRLVYNNQDAIEQRKNNDVFIYFSKAVLTAYLRYNLFQMLLPGLSSNLSFPAFQNTSLYLPPPAVLLVCANLCKNPQIMIMVIKMSNCI